MISCFQSCFNVAFKTTCAAMTRSLHFSTLQQFADYRDISRGAFRPSDEILATAHAVAVTSGLTPASTAGAYTRSLFGLK